MSEKKQIREKMEEAAKGGRFTIGFLGGSITQGSVATAPEKCYAYLVYEWWVKKFPQSSFSYVNGGIGGTSSLYGTARAWKDVLQYQPDFIVVDFSVNDEANLFFQETYEGVLRQLLEAEKHPAILLLNNVFYDTGKNAEEFHNEIGDYYEIPHVSIKETLYQQIVSGKLERTSITGDNLHPNDLGHSLVAGEIIAKLESIYLETVQNTKTEDAQNIERNENQETKGYDKKPPMTENRYQAARLLQIGNSNPTCNGFYADSREKTGMLDLYKNGWIGEKKGDSITFETECACIAIQYLKSIHQPRPVAEAVIDGDAAHPIRLDANFDETWGDCLYLESVLEEHAASKHTVEIKIVETREKQAGPFYLVSLITA